MSGHEMQPQINLLFGSYVDDRWRFGCGPSNSSSDHLALFLVRRKRSAANTRGVQLGNSKQAKTKKHEADRYAKALRPILISLTS
jgi:hypothetical protein